MSEETTVYRVKGKSGFMNNNIRNEFAAYGLEILKLLLVLYQQPLDGGGEHRQNKIRKQLGIPKPLYEPNRLVHGILNLLYDDEYVEKSWISGHWRITEKGVMDTHNRR